MSSSRTLADRFRSQRTDRIRVDHLEVHSLVEVILRPTSALEVIVESQRSDIAQSLTLRSRSQQLRVVSDDGPSAESELIELRTLSAPRVEVVGSDHADTVLQMWNGWLVGATAHAWTGNAGIVVEDLEPPKNANTRFRLWCSDGLGDPTFDDLVALVTIGDRNSQN